MKMAKPEAKNANNAKYFDYVDIPSSLETMAQFNVLRREWFQYDIDLIDAILDSSDVHPTQIKDKVLEGLRKLDVPKTVLNQLIRLSDYFLLEVKKITLFLVYYDVKLKSCLDLKWTNWGTVDKPKTLQGIIENEKYISDKLKKSGFLHISDIESILLQTSSNALMYMPVPPNDIFKMSIQLGSEPGCRYYLKKLACDAKGDHLILEGVELIEEACCNENVDKSRILSNCFCLLFFNMENKQLLMDMISKNENMVTYLLSWPWIVFFEKYLEENYLEYFCNASQVHIIKKNDYSLFKRLSRNILIRKHFNKFLSEES